MVPKYLKFPVGGVLRRTWTFDVNYVTQNNSYVQLLSTREYRETFGGRLTYIT